MIDLTVDGDVAEIVLNAPEKRNALTADGLRELDIAYADAEQAGVRALLLRGAGPAFCAGRDIAGVDPATDDVPGYLDGLLLPLLRRIAAFPAPTFAAAHGACLGVGLGLLAATDVVYVADTAKIGSPFASLGAALDSGGHALFLDRLGSHRTFDLIYTGRLMSGAEAVAAGLFSRVFPEDDVQDAAAGAARHAAQGATAAFLASKRLVARIREERLGLWETIRAETAAQTALSATDDYREGFAAFGQKRKPVFRGR